MSLVTSPGHPFSASRPRGPQGPRSHTLPVGAALRASDSRHSFFFFFPEHLYVCHAGEPEITRRVNSSKGRDSAERWGGGDPGPPTDSEEERIPPISFLQWILHVCHCVAKPDGGAKVRRDYVVTSRLFFFFPPSAFLLFSNIYESRIMTAAPKHNHGPHLAACPSVFTSSKTKQFCISVDKKQMSRGPTQQIAAIRDRGTSRRTSQTGARGRIIPSSAVVRCHQTLRSLTSTSQEVKRSEVTAHTQYYCDP